MGLLNSRISGSFAVADPDLQIGGGGRSQNIFFSVLRASVWSKNKEKRGSRKDGHFLLTRK